MILYTPSPKERSVFTLTIPPRRDGGSLNAIRSSQQQLPLINLSIPPPRAPVMPVLRLVPFVPGILGPIPNCYILMFHSEMVFIAEPSKEAAPYFHLP
jgi:hypothetical protein